MLNIFLFFIFNAEGILTNFDGMVNLYNRIEIPTPCVFTPPQQMPGWPKYVGVNPNYRPSGVNLADVNNDGYLEIIVGSTDNKVYIWDYQGNLLNGWPITLPAMVQAKVAVGDIDNNGDKEIVISARNGYVYIYNHDGTPYPNWPQNANGVIGFVAPVLFDLDRDGDLEILMAQMQSGQPGHVYIWHHNGQIYNGWPKNTDYLAVASVAVADIDNDSLFEIVCLSYYSVYVWDQNGNPKPGWPKLNVAGGMSYAQPVIADLDNDGDFEILHSYYSNNQNYVGIYHHNGINFPNWPQPYPGPQTYTMPVVGDIDGDDDLEIFGGGHVWGAPSLSARHHTGSEVNGWPVICDLLECSPIVFDVDNDGVREVLIADNLNPGHFYAYEGNGTFVPDWPIATTAAAIVNSPAVGDVDLDGDIEIALLVSDGTVNLWTLSSVPYRGYYTDWGTFYHDQWNTGWFHPKPPQNLIAQAFAGYIQLTWNKNKEPDIAGYNIYRSEISGGPYEKLNSTLVSDTTYIDSDVIPGITYYYRVAAQIKAFAESRLSNEASAQVRVDEKYEKEISEVIFPKIFMGKLKIFGKGITRLEIFDCKGRLMKTFAGNGFIEWEAGNDFKEGIYFINIERNGQKFTMKFLKLRD